VVILAHQFGADRDGWKVLADELNARGIATLALDLRGHGASTAKGGATVTVTADFMASSAAVGFDRIPGDLLQAAQWVRRQPRIDGRRLGLAGSSLGAYAALAAAPSIHPVAILALSPAGGWGDQPGPRIARAVEEAKASVFVVAAEGDADAMANVNAIKGRLGVYARIAPGQEHGFAYLPALKDMLAGWFSETLGRHSGTPESAKAREPAKPEARTEPKPEAEAKVKPEAKAKVKPEAKAKVQPEAKAKVQPEAKAKVQPEATMPTEEIN